MVDVALHIQHRRAGRLSDSVQVGVADAPIDVADGYAIKISPVDLADLFGGVAVSDLGRLALDESGVPSKLRHTRFKRAAGTSAGKEEQHRQNFVSQVSMGFAQSTLPFQVEGDVEDG